MMLKHVIIIFWLSLVLILSIFVWQQNAVQRWKTWTSGEEFRCNTRCDGMFLSYSRHAAPTITLTASSSTSVNGFAIKCVESFRICNYESQTLNSAKRWRLNQMSKSLRPLLVVSALTVYNTWDTSNVLNPNTN